MGVPVTNMTAVDRQGVIHAGRDNLPDYKAEFANETPHRTLADALRGADVFIGVSAAGLLDAELLRSMAPRPVIFALANPEPEVRPSAARAIRDDVIVATGRSDFPNQVNNVLCFPFIFRGALDVRAHAITEEMKIAAAHAIANLTKEIVPEEVIKAYPDVTGLAFGPDYILPKPMDPRLREVVASAVAKAAIASGVAGKAYPPHYLK
jgi:malate dehydrogenase (oxaloacetate-decarboxylating)(NADP+)